MKGIILGEGSYIRADWLCIGWPFCQAELKREFQTGKHFFLLKPVVIKAKILDNQSRPVPSYFSMSNNYVLRKALALRTT